MNPQRLRQRAAVVHALRAWLHARGYLEVHTPVLVPCPALEEHLEPIPAADGFLHTSPEFAMKRVLAAGLCRIYQIVPCFRAEEHGRHHSREFTMLEWYRAGAGSAELMADTIDLIGSAAAALGRPRPSFTHRRVDALARAAGMPAHLCDQHSHPQITADHEDAWFRHWVDHVEPSLQGPTVLTHYPAWQAALAQIRRGHADRFEVFMGGLELANAFAEEPSATELRRRFVQSGAARAAQGREPHPIDERLLAATPSMPRTAGIALGIDRLVMALTGAKQIDDVQVR